MMPSFDTVTDWIAIPLFIVAITFLARADLVRVAAGGGRESDSYRLAIRVGAVAATLALLLTALRFAVLATG